MPAYRLLGWSAPSPATSTAGSGDDLITSKITVGYAPPAWIYLVDHLIANRPAMSGDLKGLFTDEPVMTKPAATGWNGEFLNGRFSVASAAAACYVVASCPPLDTSGPRQQGCGRGRTARCRWTAPRRGPPSSRPCWPGSSCWSRWPR